MTRQILPRLPDVIDSTFRAKTQRFMDSIDRWNAHKQKGIDLCNGQLSKE